ncbi:Hypothetical predicted protein [Pelobates cultripes]|uniref:DUF4592 domain-containing protein n=2 Tax=Pelobates cultripes TaxID=61616 RepID=A0AAD1WDP5_PELCU|nr:Hypothetical predicted protein [Pelobates cultripes]
MAGEREQKQETQIELLSSKSSEKKRTGKFQPLRKFFGNKKKKRTTLQFKEGSLKPSHSIGNVCNNPTLSSDDEYCADLRILSHSMGTRAFSHDSIFIPDGAAEDEQGIQTLSQESVGGKVKSLQQQIAKNIRFGQPPANSSDPRMQDLDASAGEMEEVLDSPVEIIGDHDLGPQNSDLATGSPGTKKSWNAPDMETRAEEKVTPVKLSRPKRPLASSGTIESINLDSVPRSNTRLDNSAAKHKLSVKPKNQRVSKKHRGSSQIIDDTEYENEYAFNMPISPDRSMYYTNEKSIRDLTLSAVLDHKIPEKQSSELVQTERQINESKLAEEKPQNPVNLIHECESRILDEVSKLEAQKQKDEEEKKQQEMLKSLELERIRQKIEEQKELEMKELRRREEERKQRAEQCLKELEEHRKREEQKKRELEEQRSRHQANEQRLKEEILRKEEQSKIEEQKQQDLQQQEVEKAIMPKTEDSTQQEEVCSAEEEKTILLEDHNEIQKLSNQTNADEEEIRQKELKQIEAQQQERLGKESRWQELDQRQRPFTFKVSSGEKQIIFEKVHLPPVTPLKEQLVHTEMQGIKENKSNISLHALQSNQRVPHTAILVTGAQLCSTAVNINQIKDTACKSLLGLTEERRQLENPPIKNEKQSNKTKYTSESLENQSALAEWASIRSKILSKSENVNMLDKDIRVSRICSDDLTAKGKGDSHSNLRKTMSASARFSITPAWQKFPESVSSRESIIEKISKECVTTVKTMFSETETLKSTANVEETVSSKIKKQVTIENNTVGCIFSKDLPSFLVPNPPQSPRKLPVEKQNASELQLSNGVRKHDKMLQNGEEKITPFGIKLRRTNYSLRFNSDPQNEQKRKKRYSAGDSIDSVPVPFIGGSDEIESKHDSSITLSVSPAKLKKDTVKVLVETSNSSSDDVHSASIPLIPFSSTNMSSPHKDKTVPRTPIVQKPSLAPKPSSPTPPSSPLSNLNRSNVDDLSGQRMDKGEQNKEILGDDIKVHSLPSLIQSNNEEAERKDQKCSFPSIPWRDKRSVQKERPILQSRHSIDGSKLVEKETAQPMWITLALQKQKGFREQEASREGRRQAREAKHTDKIAKAPSTPTDEYRSRSGSLQKVSTPDDAKCETVVTRLQRREQLQKSNTLPTSVSVEITEACTGTPLAKDNPKRFSTPDATSVSSEPTWLALAKRKSKAWSDCPQIIK